MYYANVEPKETYEKFKRKSKMKTNEKSRAEIKYDNHYETLYLTDGDDSGEDTDTTGSSDVSPEKNCESKTKIKKKNEGCQCNIQHLNQNQN